MSRGPVARQVTWSLAVFCVLALAAPAATPSPGSPAAPPASAASDSQLAQAARDQLGASLGHAIDVQAGLATSISANRARTDQLSREVADDAARVQQLDGEIARLDVEISSTSARIEVERSQVGELARVSYTRPSSLLVELAAARSLGDALSWVNSLVLAAGRADAISKRLRQDLARLQNDEQQRMQDRELAQSLLDQATNAAGDLQQLLSDQESALGEFGQWIEEARAALAKPATPDAAQTARAVANLLVQRERMLNENLAAAEALRSVLRARQPSISALALHLTNALPLAWPGRAASITQPFGPTSVWLEPAFGPYPHFHFGIDMVIPDRQVMAAAAGIVLAVGHGETGYGTFVMIDHGSGMVTLYAHLDSAAVEPGQRVDAGTPIGVEGSTGLSTGPHLHFEVRIGGQAEDPLLHLPALGAL